MTFIFHIQRWFVLLRRWIAKQKKKRTEQKRERILKKLQVVCIVAGVRFHLTPEEWSELNEGMELILVRDRCNHYDERAIAMVNPAKYNGNADSLVFGTDIVGYMPRKMNRPFAKFMDEGYELKCEILNVLQATDIDGRITVKIYPKGTEYDISHPPTD